MSISQAKAGTRFLWGGMAFLEPFVSYGTEQFVRAASLVGALTVARIVNSVVTRTGPSHHGVEEHPSLGKKTRLKKTKGGTCMHQS